MVVRAGQEDSAGRGVACDSGLALNASGVRDVDLDELARRAGDARIRGDCECARDGGSQQPPQSADPSHQTSPLTCGTTPALLSGLPRSVSWPRATSTEDTLRLVASTLSFSSSALRRYSIGAVHHGAAYSVHAPGTPLNSRSARSSKSIPEPATRSLTVAVTSTSPGAAEPATRAPTDTAIPATLPSWSSHSPVCTPARTSRPRPRTLSTTACAQRIA